MFKSIEERNQRTQPYRDKQNDSSKKIFKRLINTFKGSENVVGFVIQNVGGSYDVVFAHLNSSSHTC